MSYRSKLFLKRDPYAREGTEELFLRAVRETVSRTARGSGEYAAMLEHFGFSADELADEASLCRIPPIPTLYFKRHKLFSVPEKKLVVPYKGRLQTAALLLPDSDRGELSDLLFRAGVVRIARADLMSETYCGMPHDGRMPLSLYTKIVSEG